MRTFAILVIFPLALFSDLVLCGQLIIYQHLGNLMFFLCVPLYMILHSVIAPISLVEINVCSRLES